MSLTPSYANILTDGIGGWKLKNITDGDAAYHALPEPASGSVKISTFTTSVRQLKSVSYLLEASALFTAIRTTANFIKLLPLFSTKLIEHKIALIDGARIISSAPTTSTPSPTGFGAIKWILKSDKEMDDNMSLELRIRRKLTKEEFTQILTSANTPADGTSDPGDSLVGLDSLTLADDSPSGVGSVYLGAAAAGTYADHIDNLQKATFKAELMCPEGGRGMYRGGAVQIDLDVDGEETSEAELLKWPAIQFRKNEAKVNFINGMVCTLPNTANDGLGIATEFNVQKMMDDISLLKVKGSGRILTSQWSALWSA